MVGGGFLSPFGYFGGPRINDLAAARGYGVEWHPMLLGISVIKVMGPPPIVDPPRHGIVTGKPSGAPRISPLVPARTRDW